MRISDWSSDGCSSDLRSGPAALLFRRIAAVRQARQLGRVAHFDLAPRHRDHPVVVEPGEAAAAGLERKPEIAGDVLPAPPQPELQGPPAHVPAAFPQPAQATPAPPDGVAEP